MLIDLLRRVFLLHFWVSMGRALLLSINDILSLAGWCGSLLFATVVSGAVSMRPARVGTDSRSTLTRYFVEGRRSLSWACVSLVWKELHARGASSHGLSSQYLTRYDDDDETASPPSPPEPEVSALLTDGLDEPRLLPLSTGVQSSEILRRSLFILVTTTSDAENVEHESITAQWNSILTLYLTSKRKTKSLFLEKLFQFFNTIVKIV